VDQVTVKCGGCTNETAFSFRLVDLSFCHASGLQASKHIVSPFEIHITIEVPMSDHDHGMHNTWNLKKWLEEQAYYLFCPAPPSTT
jgi:hypothetical protein